MTTWLVALVGGAVGSVATWAITYARRIASVKREIAANDRALRVLDDHLETWVADDTVRLRRELHEISEALNKRNLLWSGEHGFQIALAKEKALQSYRDQERTARSQEAEIGAREGRLHSLVRAWAGRSFGLTAPDRVRPILAAWAAPVTRHLSAGDPPREIDDPRKRSVKTTLADLGGDPKSLT
jgi:hypothetical protein